MYQALTRKGIGSQVEKYCYSWIAIELSKELFVGRSSVCECDVHLTTSV